MMNMIKEDHSIGQLAIKILIKNQEASLVKGTNKPKSFKIQKVIENKNIVQMLFSKTNRKILSPI